MSRAKELRLSLVIPAYNEEKIIESTLKTVTEFLERKKYGWEIILADDGSRDNTKKIAAKFKNKGVRVVSLVINSGKGAALRSGILNSKGKFIIFSDADLSVPIEFIDKFLVKLENGFDVVTGSRRLGSSDIQKHQPFLRESMGRVFTNLTKLILLLNLSDFTCGFKGFSKEAAMKIFPKSRIDRWAYDSEVLFLAKKYGFRIGEIPVSWKNREDTRVVLRKVVFESFADLIKIRINNFRGVYG